MKSVGTDGRILQTLKKILMMYVILMADRFNLNLQSVVTQKLKLNCVKYPADGDYRGHDIIKHDKRNDNKIAPRPALLVDDCLLPEGSSGNKDLLSKAFLAHHAALEDFVRKRGFTYTRCQLCLSLQSEIGELAGVINCMDPTVTIDWFVNKSNKLAAFAEELADIYIYSIHLWRSVRYDEYLTPNMDVNDRVHT